MEVEMLRVCAGAALQDHSKPLPAPRVIPALSSWAPCRWGRSQESWKGATPNLASAQDPQKPTDKCQNICPNTRKHSAPGLNKDVHFKADLKSEKPGALFPPTEHLPALV